MCVCVHALITYLHVFHLFLKLFVTAMRSLVAANVQSKATEIMKKSGIPMWKVNFGVSFFARSYTVSNSSKHVSSGKAGNHTGQKGFLAYFEVNLCFHGTRNIP